MAAILLPIFLGLVVGPIIWYILSESWIFDREGRKRRTELVNMIASTARKGEWHKSHMTYIHTSGFEVTDENWPYGIEPYRPIKMTKYFTINQKKYLARVFREIMKTPPKRSHAQQIIEVLAGKREL